MIELKEALIGRHNITKASSGITWVEPSSVKDLTPGRAVQFVDDWNKVRDMLVLPAENVFKEDAFLSDIILCPAKTESGYFFHYTDEFMYDGELHRSSGKIIKVSKELIDVSKIHDIRDVIQLFKRYRLDSTYRSLTKNEAK